MSAPNPPLIPEPFANDAGPLRNTIPAAPQPNNQLANYEQGFTPTTMTPIVAGGKPMLGPDMNGILFAVTAHLFALQGGQLYNYDAAVATAVGGYKLGAVLAMDDGSGYWINLMVNNSTDPDAGGAGWAPVYSYGFADVSGLTGGSRVLSTAEGAKGIILCTGALVANQQVIVPNRIAQWLVINATTGGFSLTVKTAAGTGVTVPQGGAGAPTNVWSDAVNVYNTVAPITIPTSVAPTPNTIPLRDNNGYLFGNYYNQSSALENPTIDGVGVFSADGYLRKISMLNFELQMQLANINGQLANAQVPYSVVQQWAATLFTSPALTGVPTAPTAPSGTNTTQIATTAFVQQIFSALASGYLRLPNGIILQWGFNTRFGSAAQTVFFNTAFPSSCFIVVASPKQASGDALGQVPTVTGNPSTASFQLAHSDGSQGAYWFAIGV
jgi:hypothetical protein